MKIARFWARADVEARKRDGQPLRISCWRWSEQSQTEAQSRAEDAVRDAARRVEVGAAGEASYGYLDRPPREEIVQEITDDDNQTIATITRNSYGSLILNTRFLMFIDVDLPYESPWCELVRKLNRFFGRQVEDPAGLLRARLLKTASEHSEYTIRLYETRAGYRCAIVNRPISPATRESNNLLSVFEADPLYAKLCQQQECYRVRLTPKHWRCGVPRPPNRYPWETARHEQQYRQWEKQYEQQCKGYATCRFVEQLGRHPIAPETDTLVKLHDMMTRIDADSPSPLTLA